MELTAVKLLILGRPRSVDGVPLGHVTESVGGTRCLNSTPLGHRRGALGLAWNALHMLFLAAQTGSALPAPLPHLVATCTLYPQVRRYQYGAG